MSNEHSKIINKVAKQRLKPLGIVQKGVSRIWLDDNGWYSTIIEFQPSSWARGSYLNIGANFHWHKEDYFSFDWGSREKKFVEYENDEQFSKAMEKFCEFIAEKILEIRKKLNTVHSAKEIILKHKFTSDIWENYHKGTICGLTGDFDGLNKFYGDVLKEDSIQEWVDLQENVKYLLSKTADLEMFKAEILKIIYETRKMKKLPEMEFMF